MTESDIPPGGAPLPTADDGEEEDGEGDEENDMQGDEDEEDEFATLQIGREQEFLQFLCEGLDATVVAPEILQFVVNELARELRQHVNDELDGYEVTDIDSFDDKLLQILQTDELREVLENMRDDLLENVTNSSQAGPQSV
jgi:hypothetical protein